MRLFQSALIVIALHACALGADFFPLREGNTWTYRQAETGQTFTVRVGQPAAISGNTYYQLTGYVDSDLYVRVEPVYGALVYWNEARNEENILTSFEQFEGGHWYAPFRPCPGQDGQGQLKRGIHDGPAGPLPDILEILYRAVGCADVGPVEEQYAEHIGMLRRTETSIAGPRTYDLISARVGSLSIDTAPTATFGVSLGPFIAGRPVSATFRLRVNSSSPLTLSFPSGQEYDFALNDSAGNTLWTWSADKAFNQSPHQRAVADEWSETVEIPWPTDAAGALRPGDYIVQALLATTAPARFAVRVPVTIAPKQ